MKYILLTALSFLSAAASAQNIPMVTASTTGAHSCALYKTNLYCWGNNDYGQLGDGTTISQLAPQLVHTGVTAVALGKEHTCAVVKASLECWGRNASGQLGDGSTTDRLYPTKIIAAGVTKVAAGEAHTCTLAAGKVNCMGINDKGQLGDGGTTDSLTPKLVTITGVADLKAGSNHTCALNSGKFLFCWGDNTYNQIGTMEPETKVPRQVFEAKGAGSGPLTGATAFQVGAEHSCALTAGGALKCWGRNNVGQIGNGASPAMIAQTIIPNNVTLFAAGGAHTCALRHNVLRCWGSNEFGQFGNDTTVDPTDVADHITTPLIVANNAPLTSLSAGANWTCGTIGTASLKASCFGLNDEGQLGDGTNTNRDEPVDIFVH